MNMYLFKASIKDVPEGRNRIRKHIFAESQEAALEKFKLEYEKPENINFNQVIIESVKEIKEAE